MKDYKIILIAFLCIVIICGIFALSYQDILRRQNNMLMANISQIQTRIGLLEKENAMEQIIVLKAENSALKSRIQDLEARGLLEPKVAPPACAGKAAQQPAAAKPKPAKSAGGNKGYLFKK
ncbi:MAG: hypothetical protein Q8N85_01325 [Candidatus Omnitrophota bacterium]|nr:hypothetical protein [Candidatus Omnitrophota bacterium]